MGVESSLGPFANEDSFLRRFLKRGLIKDGTVSAEAFEDKHETLSFTFQDDGLRTDHGLNDYHSAKELPSGDLPGLCKLTFHDLTVTLRPPLPPRPDPDPQDDEYGHLHCCTDQPSSDAQRTLMARLAERHGVVRPFVRKKKRTDLPGVERGD